MTKEHRRRTIVEPSSLSLLIVLGLLLFVTVVTVDNVAQANTLQQALSMENMQLGQTDSLTQRLSALKQRWHQQQSSAESIMTKVPPTENLPEVLCELSDLADLYDVIVTGLTLTPPSELKEGEDGRQIKLDLTVKGPYDKIKTYLTSLLATKRYFAIEAMDLVQTPTYNAGAQVSLACSWTARINLSTFFLPPPTNTSSDHF